MNKALQSWGGKILLSAVFVFAVYSNVRLILRNYQLHERVTTARAQVDADELRNQKLKLLLSYFASPSYQDVEARARLGLKKPDENVVVVKGQSQQAGNNSVTDLEQPIFQPTAPSVAPTEPNIKRWWSYFFVSK